jgi:hypothetical protein
MKNYVKLGGLLLFFLGVSMPGASDSQKTSHFSLEDEIRDLRLQNKTTLHYIKFKVRYGDYINYYREISDSTQRK